MEENLGLGSSTQNPELPVKSSEKLFPNKVQSKVTNDN